MHCIHEIEQCVVVCCSVSQYVAVGDYGNSYVSVLRALYTPNRTFTCTEIEHLRALKYNIYVH